MLGKQVRIERIVNRNDGRTIVVPMDHGITVGPIPGLVDHRWTVNEISKGGANAVLMHKGLPRASHRRTGRDIGLIIHLSASTSIGPDPNAKVLVCSVEEAIKVGADAVSIHINLGSDTEPNMLADLGSVSAKCVEWGMPLLAMMYVRGPNTSKEQEYDSKHVAHAARVAAELGADIVKVNYTGSIESFKKVTEGCPVPVIIAGGEKMESDRDVLKMVDESVKAGGAGVSIGRNVFQHKSPKLMVKAIAAIVHKRKSVEEASQILAGKE